MVMTTVTVSGTVMLTVVVPPPSLLNVLSVSVSAMRNTIRVRHAQQGGGRERGRE